MHRPTVGAHELDAQARGDWAVNGPVADFTANIDRIIGLLGKQRLVRLSLFRFRINGLSSSDGLDLTTRALRSQGLVGLLPDQRIGFLYIGPRGKGMVADLALVHHIRSRLTREMQRFAPFDEPRLASVAVAHRWADEVGDAGDLMDALHQQTSAASRAG